MSWRPTFTPRPASWAGGGWTWYTGSSGLMYRLILESVLGMRLRAGTLSFSPCLPSDWDTFTLSYRHGSSTYTVTALRGEGEGDGERDGLARVTLDGVLQEDGIITLEDDGQTRQVSIELPRHHARLLAEHG